MGDWSTVDGAEKSAWEAVSQPVDARTTQQDTASTGVAVPGVPGWSADASASQNENANGSTVGWQAQAGSSTQKGEWDVGGVDVKASGRGPNASVGVGSFKDGDGNQAYGGDAKWNWAGDGQVSAKKDTADGGSVSGGADVQGPSAWAGASVTQKGDMNYAHVGAEANAVSGGLSFGSQDPNSSSNEQMHGGVSAGAGLDARAQWGTDENGNIRVGGGLDVGPASVDFSTNDPVRSALGFLAGGGVPAGGDPMNPVNYVDTDANGKQSNMTTDAMKAVSGAYDSVSQGASDLWHHYAD